MRRPPVDLSRAIEEVIEMARAERAGRPWTRVERVVGHALPQSQREPETTYDVINLADYLAQRREH